MPLKKTFHFENDLETQKWPHKWNPCPLKHRESGIAHGSSANTSRDILFTIIGGGHIGFRANRPLEGNLNLLAMVFENLVFIPVTMQNFNNLSQSARFSQIASPLLTTSGVVKTVTCDFLTSKSDQFIDVTKCTKVVNLAKFPTFIRCVRKLCGYNCGQTDRLTHTETTHKHNASSTYVTRPPTVSHHITGDVNPSKRSGIKWLHKSVQCHPGLNHIFNFWHSVTLALRAERQSDRMSEIKNVG